MKTKYYIVEIVNNTIQNIVEYKNKDYAIRELLLLSKENGVEFDDINQNTSYINSYGENVTFELLQINC